ncbi:MAG TPA: ABC transporter ATP-binding protein [bacterium]|nr:ABC transporter ATP-binding protein [bacterium]HOL47220.1 ABC transporter ATP-binding protein [bacterium]HPQ18271.1 ABC transporter ATP-binding protein [bacterium]
MNDILISVKNIKKDFLKDNYKINVLDDISFDVKKNEFVSIMGRSGAGKTTLLHIIGTLEKPTDGEMYFQNINILLFDETEISHFRNSKIGFIFQFHYLINELTAYENVLLPARIFNNDELEEYIKRANLLFEYLGLEKRKTHFPYELSGGELQRVAFARALINNPVLLLADEPTGNLDERTGSELINLLLKLKNDFNLTILLVTHDKGISNLSDRILFLHNGKIQEIKK